MFPLFVSLQAFWDFSFAKIPRWLAEVGQSQAWIQSGPGDPNPWARAKDLVLCCCAPPVPHNDMLFYPSQVGNHDPWLQARIRRHESSFIFTRGLIPFLKFFSTKVYDKNNIPVLIEIITMLLWKMGTTLLISQDSSFLCLAYSFL